MGEVQYKMKHRRTSAKIRKRENKHRAFQPKTPLGKKLQELRRKIVESGEPLMTYEAIHRWSSNTGSKWGTIPEGTPVCIGTDLDKILERELLSDNPLTASPPCEKICPEPE